MSVIPELESTPLTSKLKCRWESMEQKNKFWFRHTRVQVIRGADETVLEFAICESKTSFAQTNGNDQNDNSM